MIMFDEKIYDYINSSEQVALFTHIRPDGDCLGSALALGIALENEGKKVDYYCPSDINESFMFLPNIKRFNKPKYKKYDLAIALDCSDINRLSHQGEIFLKAPRTIKIDHHISNDNFAELNYVYEEEPSTCEIVYTLLNQMKLPINKDIATCLYSGTSSDTGCFMHSNTTCNSHKVAADLINLGADFNNANYWLFKYKTMGQVELIKCAYNNMCFLLDGRIVFSYVRIKDLEKCGLSNLESYILINNFVGIQGTDLTVVLTEDTPNFYFVSFRSNDDKIRCDKIAEYFGGGGHVKASGCKIRGTMQTIKNKIIKAFNQVVC